MSFTLFWLNKSVNITCFISYEMQCAHSIDFADYVNELQLYAQYILLYLATGVLSSRYLYTSDQAMILSTIIEIYWNNAGFPLTAPEFNLRCQSRCMGNNLFARPDES